MTAEPINWNTIVTSFTTVAVAWIAYKQYVHGKQQVDQGKTIQEVKKQTDGITSALVVASKAEGKLESWKASLNRRRFKPWRTRI